MKIKVSLKDPDGFWDSVTDAVSAGVCAIPAISEREKEMMIENRRDAAFDALSAWVEYNECIEIEFDTDAKTATVLKP